MILQNHEALQFEEMWKFISKFLNPLGMMPDKASMDYEQLIKLNLELERKDDDVFRDFIQTSILKKEVATSYLRNLVN